MMGLNLTSIVLEFLKKNPEQHFTAREIATWVFDTYRRECREKQSQSRAIVAPLDSDAALIGQIAAEIGARRPHLQKKNPQIKTTEGRPRKYYYTELTDSTQIEQAETVPRPIKERDLYPMLAKFLWAEFQIYSKRINEKRSANLRGLNGNKWLYPDLDV